MTTYDERTKQDVGALAAGVGGALTGGIAGAATVPILATMNYKQEVSAANQLKQKHDMMKLVYDVFQHPERLRELQPQVQKEVLDLIQNNQSLLSNKAEMQSFFSAVPDALNVAKPNLKNIGTYLQHPATGMGAALGFALGGALARHHYDEVNETRKQEEMRQMFDTWMRESAMQKQASLLRPVTNLFKNKTGLNRGFYNQQNTLSQPKLSIPKAPAPPKPTPSQTPSVTGTGNVAMQQTNDTEKKSLLPKWVKPVAIGAGAAYLGAQAIGAFNQPLQANQEYEGIAAGSSNFNEPSRWKTASVLGRQGIDKQAINATGQEQQSLSGAAIGALSGLGLGGAQGLIQGSAKNGLATGLRKGIRTGAMYGSIGAMLGAMTEKEHHDTAIMGRDAALYGGLIGATGLGSIGAIAGRRMGAGKDILSSGKIGSKLLGTLTGKQGTPLHLAGLSIGAKMNSMGPNKAMLTGGAIGAGTGALGGAWFGSDIGTFGGVGKEIYDTYQYKKQHNGGNAMQKQANDAQGLISPEAAKASAAGVVLGAGGGLLARRGILGHTASHLAKQVPEVAQPVVQGVAGATLDKAMPSALTFAAAGGTVGAATGAGLAERARHNRAGAASVSSNPAGFDQSAGEISSGMSKEALPTILNTFKTHGTNLVNDLKGQMPQTIDGAKKVMDQGIDWAKNNKSTLIGAGAVGAGILGRAGKKVLGREQVAPTASNGLLHAIENNPLKSGLIGAGILGGGIALGNTLSTNKQADTHLLTSLEKSAVSFLDQNGNQVNLSDAQRNAPWFQSNARSQGIPSTKGTSKEPTQSKKPKQKFLYPNENKQGGTTPNAEGKPGPKGNPKPSGKPAPGVGNIGQHIDNALGKARGAVDFAKDMGTKHLNMTPDDFTHLAGKAKGALAAGGALLLPRFLRKAPIQPQSFGQQMGQVMTQHPVPLALGGAGLLGGGMLLGRAMSGGQSAQPSTMYGYQQMAGEEPDGMHKEANVQQSFLVPEATEKGQNQKGEADREQSAAEFTNELYKEAAAVILEEMKPEIHAYDDPIHRISF